MVQTAQQIIEIPQLLLDMVTDVLVVRVVRVPQVLVVEETVVLPQLHLVRNSFEVVDIPVVTLRLLPMVQTVLRALEFPQSLFDKVVDVTVLLVVRVPQVPSWR